MTLSYAIYEMAVSGPVQAGAVQLMYSLPSSSMIKGGTGVQLVLTLGCSIGLLLACIAARFVRPIRDVYDDIQGINDAGT